MPKGTRTTTKRKKIGRPKLPAAQLKSVIIDIGVSEEEAQQLYDFVDRERETLRPWARRMLLLISEGWRLVKPESPK